MLTIRRTMSTFSNFAVSYSIISVVAAGCVTTYYQALNFGGPVAIVWGWVLVSVFTTLVAMAMAEIAASARRRPRYRRLLRPSPGSPTSRATDGTILSAA